jgi:asparagine synthase (glutamine-hydrolysing)
MMTRSTTAPKSRFSFEFSTGHPNRPETGNEDESIAAAGDVILSVYGRIYWDEASAPPENAGLAAYLLQKFMELGIRFLKNLDGDFTLILQEAGNLKIIRDMKGAGPQVFYTRDFVSDTLQSLLIQSKIQIEPELEDLSLFLRYGFVPPDKSGVEGISRLPAGHMLEYAAGNITVSKNHSAVASKSELAPDKDDLIQRFRKLHVESVKQRIRNRDKIGLLLSGGYDSGGNLAAIRSFYAGNLTAYTVGFKNNPLSELPFVKLMAEKYQVDLKVYEIDGSELTGLPDIVSQTGVPFQESGMMINHSVMKMVAEDKPDIVLGGDGNDQYFGTGARETAMRWLAGKTGIIWILRVIRVLFGWLNVPTIMKKLNLLNDRILNLHQADRWGFSLGELQVTPNEKDQFPDCAKGSFDELYDFKRTEVDIRFTVNEVILFKASRMAELFGNRIAFPYTTLDQYRFILQLPRQFKTRGSLPELLRGKGKSKFIHKLSYMDVLPASITSRKKQGGFVPLSVFFDNKERNERIFQFMEQSELAGKLLKNKKHTVNSLKAELEHPQSWFWARQESYFKIFNLLVLAVWEHLILQNRSPDELNQLFTDIHEC